MDYIFRANYIRLSCKKVVGGVVHRPRRQMALSAIGTGVYPLGCRDRWTSIEIGSVLGYTAIIRGDKERGKYAAIQDESRGNEGWSLRKRAGNMSKIKSAHRLLSRSSRSEAQRPDAFIAQGIKTCGEPRDFNDDIVVVALFVCLARVPRCPRSRTPTCDPNSQQRLPYPDPSSGSGYWSAIFYR